jgi:luciferase family oxidoreductase group 1
MLPNHVPLKVAETFRMLAAFFPGRIDLGIGRAAGTDPRTARLLRRLKAGEEIPSSDDLAADLGLLRAYLEENDPPRGPFATSTVAAPGGGYAPDLWLLGSSASSGALAARAGLPFAYAHHFAPAEAVDVVRAYKRDFRPSPRGSAPRALLAVAALCAPSDAEAEALGESLLLAGLQRMKGLRDLPFPSAEETRAYVYDETDRALVAGFRAGGFVGGPATVAGTLRALAEAAGADELMITTDAHDVEVRKRSYRLIAEAMRAG